VKQSKGFEASARWALAGFGVTAFAANAYAAKPGDGGLGLQQAATPVMRELSSFHDMVLVIITAITALVLALLIWVMVRYNAKANPEPRKFTHNTLVEVIWTVAPIIILIVIAVPSFKLLYMEDDHAKAEMTIKATGHQWYWSYEYPDHGGVSFDAIMLTQEEVAAAGRPRDEYRLATDNALVVPENTRVRVLVTGADVLHSWTVPAFGIKMDAIPGRLNATWFLAEKPGVYFGQCSELCGKDHAFMPIEVRVVSKPEFAAWIQEQQVAQGVNPPERQARVDDVPAAAPRALN
jgi:cytochrome c oxidase subunit 2